MKILHRQLYKFDSRQRILKIFHHGIGFSTEIGNLSGQWQHPTGAYSVRAISG